MATTLVNKFFLNVNSKLWSNSTLTSYGFKSFICNFQCRHASFNPRDFRTSERFEHAKILNDHHVSKLYQKAREELKKFYKNASIATADGWYEINLDKRKLRTPLGNVFKVPSEPLALAVATEWNSQESVVNRNTMHLTVLCNTALENPMHKTREQLSESIVHFLETDTICYRLTEPPELAKLESEKWDPILEWAANRYGLEITPTTSISPPLVSTESKVIIRRHLLSYSDWALFGYHYAVDSIKSLLIVMALVDKHISVEKAVELARLEQFFQTNHWGTVEWYHNMEQYELQSRLAAAALFVHWCSESSTIKQKASIHPV